MGECINPPEMIIRAAIEVSKLSPCQSKRGAAIWSESGDLIASACNRKPTGFTCDGSADCKRNCSKDAIHAEQLALIRSGHGAIGAEMLHVKTVEGILVPSMRPSCLQCSKLIIEAGISGMWLFHEKGWQRYTPQQFHWYSGAYMPPPYKAEASNG